MQPNSKKKIEKIIKIFFDREIRKEKVFDDQKKPEAKAKTGAKLLKRIQELSSCNPLRNLEMKRKVVLKKGLALVTIIAVIITAYLQNTNYTQAAAFKPYRMV